MAKITNAPTDTTNGGESDEGIGIAVRDGAGRRRFLRTGGALLAAAPVLATRPVFAADCDRAGSATAEQKQQAGAGSDSDVGAGSDPIGCGRYKDDPPKISRRDTEALPPTVDRIAG